jgi:TonB family protein
VTVFVLASPGLAQDRVRPLLEDARTQLSQLNTDSAIVLLGQALGLQSGASDAQRVRGFVLLGIAHLMDGRPDSARAAFHGALQLDLALRADSLFRLHNFLATTFDAERNAMALARVAAQQRGQDTARAAAPAAPTSPVPDRRVLASPGAAQDSTVAAVVGRAARPVVSNQPYMEAAVDERPVVISGTCVQPPYPEQLRRAGISGRVTMEFIIDTLGRAERNSLMVVSNGGQALFEEPARETALSCRFRPGRIQGRAVRVLKQQDIAFQLNPGTPAGATARSATARADRSHAWEMTVTGSAFLIDAYPGGFRRLFLGGGFQLAKRLNQHVSLGAGFTFGSSGGGESVAIPSVDLEWGTDINRGTALYVPIGLHQDRLQGSLSRSTTYGAHAGLGILKLVSEGVALRVEVRMALDHYSPGSGTALNEQLNVGLSFFPGRSAL